MIRLVLSPCKSRKATDSLSWLLCGGVNSEISFTCRATDDCGSGFADSLAANLSALRFTFSSSSFCLRVLRVTWARARFCDVLSLYCTHSYWCSGKVVLDSAGGVIKACGLLEEWTTKHLVSDFMNLEKHDSRCNDLTLHPRYGVFGHSCYIV